MSKFIDFKKLWPHLLVIVSFAVLSVGYMSPILKGKALNTGDPMQMRALQSEIRHFAAASGGEYSGWTNGLFGGMPTYFIGGEGFADGIFAKIQPQLYTLLSLQGTYIFLYLLGAYLLLIALGCGLWESLLGAIGYAFFTYNIQIIEAGHLAKIYAFAFAPIMLAGLAMAFRGRMWLGVVVSSIGAGFLVNANHPQITFYALIILLIFSLFELVRAIQNKKTGSFVMAAVLAAVFGLTAVATNTAHLWTGVDHAKETIRGGSELTPKTTGAKSDGGLDKDYAFGWSQGKLETLTFLIPNFSGGASSGELDAKSETFKALTNQGVDGDTAAQFVSQISSYWGDQQFVSGGVYAGAIICFLFVLGLFFADKRYRWPLAVAALLTLLLGWGGNFKALNYFLFDHVPMFNKFRAVSMILSLTQMCMIAIVALGLKNIFENRPSWADFKRPFFISLGLTAGVSLVLWLMPSLVGLRSANDTAMIDQLTKAFGNNANAANAVYNALLDDRASLLSSDALRSLVLILLAAAALWAYVTQKLKAITPVAVILVVLVLGDMWSVNKRYLNADAFTPKVKNTDDFFSPSAADLQILQDKDPNYRVIDVTQNPFSYGMTSAFHKSLGGYSATKLQRYQDLIENQLSKNNMAVLNMLNTKYFITADDKGQPVAQTNPAALGNAWFVREIKTVNNADEEMKALDNFNPRSTAIVDKRFTYIIKDAKPSADSSAKIALKTYKPNALTYEYDSKEAQIAVFSEIYYKGNVDWKSYVDGKETPHFRANYVLRAMALPAGKHTVEFKFDPVTVREGRRIDLWASIALVILIAGALFMDKRTNKAN